MRTGNLTGAERVFDFANNCQLWLSKKLGIREPLVCMYLKRNQNQMTSDYFQLFESPQRNAGFHERIDKELAAFRMVII
jgi:hypothetical protein